MLEVDGIEFLMVTLRRVPLLFNVGASKLFCLSLLKVAYRLED